MKKRHKILIVDDEENIASSMSDLLEMKGYEVKSANNGVEGLKILADEPIDLVLLDLKMPRMDGYMFMEHLKERWENGDKRFPLPQIIVMTAVDKKNDLGLANNLGAVEYLNKPYKSDDLLSLLKKLLK
ncbi:MAG: Response regulator MprA [Elusimicrobia bacterium]|nr:Response regulator MprA [Elusimicrobiota bacterium]